MPHSTGVLLVFAKYPTPGRVKTRLTPQISATQAADVHKACIRVTVQRLAVWPGVIRWLVTPDNAQRRFARKLLEPGAVVWPQGDGDLGQRMARAACRAFEEGAAHVLLIGTDCPFLPLDRLSDTEQALEAVDVVLGPCEDGGYYLLGMNAHHPSLFADIAWGSADVAEQTRCRAAAAGLRCSELPVSYDLDRVEDLRRAARDLAAGPPERLRREFLPILKDVLKPIGE